MDADIAAKILAKRLSASTAPSAVSAYEVEINRCAIADLDVGDALANGDNIAAEFVPHNSWRLAAEAPTAHVEECETHAPRSHFQDSFSRLWLRGRSVLDHERLTPIFARPLLSLYALPDTHIETFKDSSSTRSISRARRMSQAMRNSPEQNYISDYKLGLGSELINFFALTIRS
jgi:hypothetical protein